MSEIQIDDDFDVVSSLKESINALHIKAVNSSEPISSIKSQLTSLLSSQITRESLSDTSSPPLKKTKKQLSFNIGGTLFLINPSILVVKSPENLISRIISGENVPEAVFDGTSHFIDRDPTHFERIVSYLETGSFPFDDQTSLESLSEILFELRFYRFNELLEPLKKEILFRKRKVSIEYVDEDIEIDFERLWALREEENKARVDLKNGKIQGPGWMRDVFSPIDGVVKFPINPSPGSFKGLPFFLADDQNNQEPFRVVGSLEGFKARFDETMGPHLKGLDWSNVFAAGGCVLPALLPDAARSFSTSDIDLFLYGLDKAASLEKISKIYDTIRSNVPGDILIVRTSRTITFITDPKFRHVQVILRLYTCPVEVILGFDLDCVCVGYDGDRVWATPRAERAIATRVNLADPTRQTFRTTSYEYRLWKYSKRGFAVGIPGFKREKVNSAIYLRRFNELSGLAKLLLLEERDYLRKHPVFEDEGTDILRRYYRSRQDETNDRSLLRPEITEQIIDYNMGILCPLVPPRTLEWDLRDRTITIMRGFNRRDPGLFTEEQTPIERCRVGLSDDDDICITTITSSLADLSSDTRHIFFIYGRTFADVLDTRKASEFISCAEEALEYYSDVTDEIIVHMPPYIEFLGSMQEYVDSLPNVELDWYQDAYVL